MENIPSIPDTLFEVIASHFNVVCEKLTMNTSFGNDLAIDEHDMEELRISYENARGVIIRESFNDAKTISDLFDIVSRYS